MVVLGASDSTFVEVTWTQGLHNWIGFHQRAFQLCLFVVMSGIGIVPVL
ncbi:hypothetical protein DFAR_3210002 [Desulfarculales bacterium]